MTIRRKGLNLLHIEKSERGMTLIEVIIVVVVAGILMGALYQIFITGHFIYTKSQYEENLIQNARVAMDWIVRDVRGASTISVDQNQEVLTIWDTSTYSIEYKVMDSNGSKVLARGIIKNGETSYNPVTSPDTYVKTCTFSSINSTQSPSLTIGVSVKLELYPFNVGAKKIVKTPLGHVRSFILEGKAFSRKLVINEK